MYAAILKRPSAFYAVFIVLLVFSSGSQAAFISDVFQPSSTDASVRMLLRPLFGGLVDEAMGDGGVGGDTALSNIIKFALVNIIVPFGGLLLLYSTYMGISMSALSGEIFGDRKNAYFVAVRTVIGFGMIAPTPIIKGLALVNLLLMWLTLHGVGGASSEWGVVVDEFTKNPIILTSAHPPKDLFDGMLQGEICAAIYNDTITEGGETDVPDGQKKQFAKISSGNKYDLLGWPKKGVKTNDGGCGTIRIERKADLGTVDTLVPLGSIKSIDTSAKAVQDAMQAQTASTLEALHNRAAEVAKMIIDSGNVTGAQPPPPESYYNLMNWFRDQQQQAAKNIASTAIKDVSQAFTQAAKQEGWATAGFYFLGLSSFQQVVNRAIAMDWITVNPPASDMQVIKQIADETRIPAAKNQLQQMQAYINTGHKQLAAEQILPVAATEVTGAGSGISWVMEESGKVLNDVVVDSINSNATPLGAAASIGSGLITIGWSAIGGGGALYVGASRLPDLLGGDKAKGYASAIMSIGGYFLLAGALLMLVCLLPALAWGRRILAWVVKVSVAQFAGPAWMVMHIHHEGDGVTGNASGGYMLALQLALTPMLDITALSFVYALMVVSAPFMNATIMPVVLAMGSGTLALLAVFLTVIINVGIIFALVALLDRFDHEVLAFIGGRGSDLNLDHDGDRSRMMALMAFTNRKMPGVNLPKNNNNGNGGGDKEATIKGGSHKGWQNMRGPSKISNDHLMPKDK